MKKKHIVHIDAWLFAIVNCIRFVYKQNIIVFRFLSDNLLITEKELWKCDSSSSLCHIVVGKYLDQKLVLCVFFHLEHENKSYVKLISASIRHVNQREKKQLVIRAMTRLISHHSIYFSALSISFWMEQHVSLHFN